MNKLRGVVTGPLLSALSLGLIAFGVLFINHFESVRAMSTQPLTVLPQPTVEPAEMALAPTAMTIERLNLKLSIRQGSFNASEGQWEINDTDAFIADTTATPLIYGHNTDVVFAPLAKLQEGDTLQLTYEDGSIRVFTYAKTTFIAPNDVSVLNVKKKDTVLLLTCEGIFNDSRRIAYFEAQS